MKSSNAAPPPLASLFTLARSAATRMLSEPALFSVLVDVTPEPHEVAGCQFGFQQLVSPWFRAPRLRTCWIRTAGDGERAEVTSSGTFSAAQMKQLSAAGVEFPPPALALENLGLEPRDVLDRLRDDAAGGSIVGTVHLSLCVFDSQLAWRAIQERPDGGVRTLILSAHNGSTLYER
jgi:hypothetical protein